MNTAIDQSQPSPILSAPKHITSLATAGVIVELKVSVYTGKMSDTAMADKVSQSEGAKSRVMSVSHDLFVGDADLKNLLNHSQTVRNWVERETYDWAGNLHYLESYKIPTFMADYAKHEQVHDALREKFAAGMEDKIANAAFIRGPLFDRKDYPTAEWIRSRFTMSLNIMDVPQGDFRVTIADDLADDLRYNYERQTQEYISGIKTAQLGKLRKLMESISHCCELETVVQADGTTKVKRRRLYDTTIEQAVELCDEIGRFNPAEDAQLDQIRSDLFKVLNGINVDALRESETMRATVKSDVDQILAKF